MSKPWLLYENVGTLLGDKQVDLTLTLTPIMTPTLSLTLTMR